MTGLMTERPSMKVFGVLLAVLITMCGVVGTLLSIEEKPNSHGVDHTQFTSTMQQGGAGVERHTHLWLLGWAFATLQVVFIVTCMTLGMVERRQGMWVFGLGGSLFVLLFTLLFITDAMYARGDATPLVLSFPLPTALMLYGISTIPLLFMFIYIKTFDSWILKPEDLERFQQLVKNAKHRKTNIEH